MWRRNDSLLSPLFIGLKSEPTNQEAVLGWIHAALESVPPTKGTRTFRRPLSIKSETEPITRRVEGFLKKDRKPLENYVQFISRGPATDDPKTRYFDLIWTVGFLWLKAGLCAPAIDPSFDILCLEVEFVKISGGRIQGASQLALFRHLTIEFIRSTNPDLVIIGGQDRFDENWWLSQAEHAAVEGKQLDESHSSQAQLTSSSLPAASPTSQRACPEGHEVSEGASFCGTCGVTL